MKFITVALLFLLTIPGLALGQARITQREENTPFEGIIFGCDDGVNSRSLPEPVAIFGSVNSRFHMTETGNSTTIVVKTTTKGTAIALVTKAEYNFSAQSSLRSSFDSSDLEQHFAPEETKFTDNFNIPGLYKVHFNVRMVYGKDSVFKMLVNNLRVRCPTIDFP